MTERLPIYDIERDILDSLLATKRLVLQAPTGSGKSTQVPQMLLKHGLLGDGQCVILQPRRLAARLLASRVAKELDVELGREVGYQVRFENFTSRATRIKFETEGILLRQLIQDETLPGVSAVIFDEFHERHLYGDITLARALDIQEQHRPDLLIAVMSATLNAGELEAYLSHSAVPQSALRVWLLRPALGGPHIPGRDRISSASPRRESPAAVGTGGGGVWPVCSVGRTGRRSGLYARGL